MTEDWRASLDKRETVAAVAVDLRKAFDTVCHNLLLAKLGAYGLSDEAVELMSSYLHGRRQRVRLDNCLLKMATSLNNRSTSRTPTGPFGIQLVCQRHELFYHR